MLTLGEQSPAALSRIAGVMVLGAVAGGSATQAGVQPGDTILVIAGNDADRSTAVDTVSELITPFGRAPPAW